MNVESEKPIGLIVDEWRNNWLVYISAPVNAQKSNREKLIGAVHRFLGTHRAWDKTERPTTQDVVAMALLQKAIPLSGTHNENYVLDTLTLMFCGLEKSPLPTKLALFWLRLKNGALKTKKQRLAMLLFPFFALPDLYLLMRDYGELSFMFMVFLTPSIGCLLFALTRVGAWVTNGGK